MYGGLIWAQAGGISHELVVGPFPMARVPGGYRVLSRRTWSRIYLTRDGAILLQGRDLQKLLVALNWEHLGTDPRFAAEPERPRNLEAPCTELTVIFRARTTSEWKERLASAGVEHVEVRDYAAIAGDEQAYLDSDLAELGDEAQGSVRIIRNPLRLSKTPTRVAAHAPELGEQIEEVLFELGYGWDKISSLRESGVI